MVIREIIKNFMFISYYLVCIHLPSSRIPYMKLFTTLRSKVFCASIDKCGKNTKINKGVIASKNLKIGDNVTINENVRIRAGVTIGTNVEIAPGVTLLTTNHNFSSRDIPITEQGHGEINPIFIEDDVWIGTNAIILPGVRIRKGTIIGAGSIVTKTFPEYSIVGGNPAKLIRAR